MRATPFLITAIIGLFCSCVTINNKNYLLPISELGLNQEKLQIDGYFYQVIESKAYPYYKNDYGGYSQDTSKGYQQTRIIPLILNANGTAYALGYFSGMQNNSTFNFEVCGLFDNNSLVGAQTHFECYIQNQTKSKFNFMNKKSEIWNQGVYTIQDKKIVLQIFYNVWGDYFLYEKHGQVNEDGSIAFNYAKDYQNNTEHVINEKYFFRECLNMPEIESYILNNEAKFRKR